jgi:hypothetical protein
MITLNVTEEQYKAIIAGFDCALSACYKGGKTRFQWLFDAKMAVRDQKEKQERENSNGKTL